MTISDIRAAAVIRTCVCAAGLCAGVLSVGAEALRGRVIEVTHLGDAGPGSLRAALLAGGPRTVVFRVGGELKLLAPVVVTHPQVHVAGGTAPGGVCVLGEIEVRAESVVLEGLEGCEHGAGWRLGVLDSDADGLPDAWERRAGLDPVDPADAVRDADGDGRTPLEAYLLGGDGRGERERESDRLLRPEAFAHHVEFFNTMEPERVVNRIPNTEAWGWMLGQVPLFECPDAVLEEIYYFRWWALRKHVKQVGCYGVYTEFIELDTKAPFIPPERTIASALGHHFMETRWLRDQTVDEEYLDYWMRGNDGGPQPHFHQYSSWLAEALWERALVTGDFAGLKERFAELVEDYRRWQRERQRPDTLYWQYDVWDAMEESISGSRTEQHIRPTINSYMYGNALALSKMAARFGEPALEETLRAEAASLRQLIQERLWNPTSRFFEVERIEGGHASVREAIGYLPWYFNIPEPGRGYEVAWEQLVDPAGFMAPYGLTTAEIRHPAFRSHGIGTCEWDGAVWPYATSQTLGALANALRQSPSMPLTRKAYLNAFFTYARAHYFGGLPYIGEYHDERSGVWLKGRHPRSAYYHHSTFADLLFTDVLGVVPSEGSLLTIDPFIDEDEWDWWCLEDLPYHGRRITLFWDHDGSRYGRGRGFHLLVDGVQVERREALDSITIDLDRVR